VRLFVVVSVAATAALLSLVQGLRNGEPLEVAMGAALGVAALLGIVILARIVVVTEREARRR
jgi:hypothetical protein